MLGEKGKLRKYRCIKKIRDWSDTQEIGKFSVRKGRWDEEWALAEPAVFFFFNRWVLSKNDNVNILNFYVYISISLVFCNFDTVHTINFNMKNRA